MSMDLFDAAPSEKESVMKQFTCLTILAALFIITSGCAHKTTPHPWPADDAETWSPALAQTMQWFHDNQAAIEEAMTPGRILYYLPGSSSGTCSRDITNDAIISLGADVTNMHMPIYSHDRRNLFLSRSEHALKKKHIVCLSRGKPARVLFTVPDHFNYFDVSPDLSEVCFDSRIENRTHIFRGNVATGEITVFSDKDVGGVFPSYSPCGKYLAYMASRKLRIRSIRDGGERILVDDALLKELPKWSPDGRWIVYQAAREGESYDICKANVKTGEVVRLTDNPGMDANPSFNRKGDRIVFVTSPKKEEGGQTLAVMNADGSGVVVDSDGPENVFFPVF